MHLLLFLYFYLFNVSIKQCKVVKEETLWVCFTSCEKSSIWLLMGSPYNSSQSLPTEIHLITQYVQKSDLQILTNLNHYIFMQC